MESSCQSLNELHLFAGGGGGILGGMLLGHTTVCAVEIAPYCRQILLQRQRDRILPKFPIWDDVRTFDGRPWRGSVDVVCGGFPCQDISTAGKGAGLSGERSGLWSEFARIIGEVRPSIAFVENSPILTSRGLGIVLRDLAELGYDAKWGVLGAAHAGAPHLRNRIWILAYAKHGGIPFGRRACNAVENVFERAGISGDVSSGVRIQAEEIHADVVPSRERRNERQSGVEESPSSDFDGSGREQYGGGQASITETQSH